MLITRKRNGKILRGPGGKIAADLRCCTCVGSAVSGCPCCPHLMDLCLANATLNISITGAIAGSGTMSRSSVINCPKFVDNGITLTEDCGTPGFQVSLELICTTNPKCIELLSGFIDALSPPCTIIPDTSRGAASDGWFSSRCNALRVEYHFKTSGASCECLSGTPITIVVTE